MKSRISRKKETTLLDPKKVENRVIEEPSLNANDAKLSASSSDKASSRQIANKHGQSKTLYPK
ncbi:MAG TPA: hypothetical protein QF772_04725 [Nitrospinaceae bacterium]|jgi:hypothetical protein|nr:hypothetical protein [Nitrospinota bacterium]MDP6335574.1 hypothetical protein [Nitrospinaceae bacterium]MDP7148222.1 hypothetical protein [Nitrospinaceae bacterium]HAX45637.1 hypothetical protein [Nitrospina sp.]HJO57507.1 hypothetical protein [Nitrospinaceae bacterium]|tara:strand:+ start:3312 stop:3500 length:189 start_codon:yes stop_codon:yes gene_type:complete